MKKDWLQALESPVALLVLGGVVVFLAGLAFGGAIVGSMTDALKDWSEIVRNFGLLLAAVFGLGFAIWRALLASRQTKVQEAAHITDRFSKAVEQLGDKSVAVRIGGLYALKRIAEDSPERDHIVVMDVLTNFIRHTPYIEEQREIAFSWNAQIRRQPEEEPETKCIDCPDVATAIEIMQGRNERQRAIEAERAYVPSLTLANLSYLNLDKANFRGLVLNLANLMGAHLMDANLMGANLTVVNLMGANLTVANLMGATLHGADLTGADLTCANLTDADFTEADLTKADLGGADLAGAELTRANLTDADLTQEQLNEAHYHPDHPPTLSAEVHPPESLPEQIDDLPTDS